MYNIAIIFALFQTCAIYSQAVEVKLIHSRLDTLPNGKILRSFHLQLANVQDTENDIVISKILEAKGFDVNGEIIEPDSKFSAYFFRTTKDLFLAFEHTDSSKKIEYVKGKITYAITNEKNYIEWNEDIGRITTDLNYSKLIKNVLFEFLLNK